MNLLNPERLLNLFRYDICELEDLENEFRFATRKFVLYIYNLFI